MLDSLIADNGSPPAREVADEALVEGATSANTANTLVKRNASGNFSAGTITAALTGNATSSTDGTAAKTVTDQITAAGLALIDDASAAAQRTTLGLGSAALLVTDADGALAANSDANAATQKAVKTYADAIKALLGGLTIRKISSGTGTACNTGSATVLGTFTRQAGEVVKVILFDTVNNANQIWGEDPGAATTIGVDYRRTVNANEFTVVVTNITGTNASIDWILIGIK